MAKAEGPLYSMSASGSIGGAITFGRWKGRNTVRRLVIPENPKSTLQGYVRASLKSVSKWLAKVQTTAQSDAVDSVIYKAGTASCPADQNWNAWLMQGFLDLVMSSGAMSTTLFAALVSGYSTALTSAARTAFGTNATALGLVDINYDYGYMTTIPAGLQLYFGAAACVAKGIIGTAPYNTAVNSWVASDVDNFKTDHVAAT